MYSAHKGLNGFVPSIGKKSYLHIKAGELSCRQSISCCSWRGNIRRRMHCKKNHFLLSRILKLIILANQTMQRLYPSCIFPIKHFPNKTFKRLKNNNNHELLIQQPRTVFACRKVFLKRCENTLECKEWCDGERNCLLAETDLHMEIRVTQGTILLNRCIGF